MRKASEARFYALTTATACALALIAGVVGAPARAVIQDLVFDQYQRWRPRPYAFDQPVRVVDVDEELLKRLGQWPWSRDRLAALVEALKGRRGCGDRIRLPVLRKGPRRRRRAGRRDPG